MNDYRKRMVLNVRELMEAMQGVDNSMPGGQYIQGKRRELHTLVDTFVNVELEARGYTKHAFNLPDINELEVEHEQALFAIRWDLEQMLDLLAGHVVYVGDTAWMYWREEVLTIVVNDLAKDYGVKTWQMIELVEDARE